MHKDSLSRKYSVLFNGDKSTSTQTVNDNLLDVVHETESSVEIEKSTWEIRIDDDNLVAAQFSGPTAFDVVDFCFTRSLAGRAVLFHPPASEGRTQ